MYTYTRARICVLNTCGTAFHRSDIWLLPDFTCVWHIFFALLSRHKPLKPKPCPVSQFVYLVTDILAATVSFICGQQICKYLPTAMNITIGTPIIVYHNYSSLPATAV